MALVLQKSRIDPLYFEVLNQGEVIREIKISFKIYRWPNRFSSLQELEEWIYKEERKRAKFKALRLLGLKSRTAIDLKAKLAAKGFSDGVVSEVIESLFKMGYLQEEKDAVAQYIERQLKKGKGPRFIEQGLRAQGLDPACVRIAVSSERQREAIQKLLPKLKNPAAALARRGFDPEIIYSELKNYL